MNYYQTGLTVADAMTARGNPASIMEKDDLTAMRKEWQRRKCAVCEHFEDGKCLVGGCNRCGKKLNVPRKV